MSLIKVRLAKVRPLLLAILAQLMARDVVKLGGAIPHLINAALYFVAGAMIWKTIQAGGFGKRRIVTLFKRDSNEARREPVEKTTFEHSQGVKAGFWQRAAAFLLDLIVLAGAELVILRMAWTFEGSLDGFWEAVGLLFIGMLVATLYFVGHYSTTGQTPGKDLLGIRIVSIDGSGLSLGKGLLRCMGLFSFGPLIVGNFWAVWDHDGQAWHDKIAGTTVVRDDGQAAPTLPPKDARRRQKRWLVGLALPMLLVWLGAAELAGLGCIDAASRINALRWIDHSGPVQDAIRIDMSSLGLQLAEVQSLRAEGLPGSYTSGAIAKYRYQGRVVTWLAALRYDSAEAQDTREASSSVEQSFLDKYCPPLSCDWTHTRGERSFVMAMADDGTVDPTDVLNLVRGPRTGALRWLHLLFTGRG